MLWRSSIPRLSGLMAMPVRGLHASSRLLNSNVFAEMTSNIEEKKQVQTAPVPEEVRKDPKTYLHAKDDAKLQEYYRNEEEVNRIAAEKAVTPLKRKLFQAIVDKHGFFKNNQVITEKSTGETFKVSLTREEIEALEPSIYLNSGRLKTSVKKTMPVNRFVRGYFVKNAINQLHFNQKKVATELEKLLKEGLQMAREKGYDENGLWIEQVWSGSDGDTRKMIDCKARGRNGIIRMRHAHIKVILRTEMTLKRLKWEKQQKQQASKPRMMLNNEPLNFKVRPFYKW